MIDELKSKNEFYSSYIKEEDIKKFASEWADVDKILLVAEAEESLKSPHFSLGLNMNTELTQLKQKHYDGSYGSEIKKELEILSKYKEYFIKVKDWQHLYELVNKKFLVDINYLIENDEWEKIRL